MKKMVPAFGLLKAKLCYNDVVLYIEQESERPLRSEELPGEDKQGKDQRGKDGFSRRERSQC